MSLNQTFKNSSTTIIKPGFTSFSKSLASPQFTRSLATFEKVVKYRKNPKENELKGRDYFMEAMFDYIPNKHKLTKKNVTTDKIHDAWVVRNKKGDAEMVILDHFKRKLRDNMGSPELQELFGASYLATTSLDHLTLVFTDCQSITAFTRGLLCDQRMKLAIICCDIPSSKYVELDSTKLDFKGTKITKIFVGKSNYKDFLPKELLKYKVIDVSKLPRSVPFSTKYKEAMDDFKKRNPSFVLPPLSPNSAQELQGVNHS